MNKEIKLENRTEWITLYCALSRHERELTKEIIAHNEGTIKLWSIQEAETMLKYTKSLLDKMNQN